MRQSLVETRFKKSLATYDSNANVQKNMANTLINLIPETSYSSILEIGCGTGILTKLCVERFSYNSYIANDILPDCVDYITKHAPEIEFCAGNIEEHTDFNRNFDLIISNAVLQWIKEPQKLINKLKQKLNTGGYIAFSTFGAKNFYEIKEIFNISIDYPQYENVVKEDICEIEFTSLNELLKHIKYTGVNAIANYQLTKGKLIRLEAEYRKRFGKIKLTYNPVYILIN